MLDGLTEPQIADLQADMKDVVFAPRSVVFQQGALSDTIFVISSGRVRLSIVSETGEEFSPNLVEKGGVIGLAAALLHRPRIVSASAVDKVHTKSLPIASVERQMLAAPLFARNIARLLAEFTVDHIARSGFLVLDSATSRLARILVKFSGADEFRSDYKIVGLTHEDLARMVGASRTWVSLTLAEFERKRLITKGTGVIHIVDADRLARCCSR